MNDENRLSERLQELGAAVSSTPSLLDDVMRRIGDSPEPVRRRSRRKLCAAACLATAACLVVSVVGWMTGGGDGATETASIDGTHSTVQPVNTRENQATDAHDVRQKPPGRGTDSVSRQLQAMEARGAAFREDSFPKPQLSDFAGLWRGTAVDKPEDGTKTDPVGIRLTISKSGRLEGVAFDRFAGGEALLEDIYVVGGRLEFKVRHRTGVRMQVTLGLLENKLKGDAIPIRSDESRCDVVLHRQGPAALPRTTKPSKP